METLPLLLTSASTVATTFNAYVLKRQSARLKLIHGRTRMGLEQMATLIRERDEMLGDVYELYTLGTELRDVMDTLQLPAAGGCFEADESRAARRDDEVCAFARSHTRATVYVDTSADVASERFHAQWSPARDPSHTLNFHASTHPDVHTYMYAVVRLLGWIERKKHSLTTIHAFHAGHLHEAVEDTSRFWHQVGHAQLRLPMAVQKELGGWWCDWGRVAGKAEASPAPRVPAIKHVISYQPSSHSPPSPPSAPSASSPPSPPSSPSPPSTHTSAKEDTPPSPLCHMPLDAFVRLLHRWVPWFETARRQPALLFTHVRPEAIVVHTSVVDAYTAAFGESDDENDGGTESETAHAQHLATTAPSGRPPFVLPDDSVHHTHHYAPHHHAFLVTADATARLLCAAHVRTDERFGRFSMQTHAALAELAAHRRAFDAACHEAAWTVPLVRVWSAMVRRCHPRTYVRYRRTLRACERDLRAGANAGAAPSPAVWHELRRLFRARRLLRTSDARVAVVDPSAREVRALYVRGKLALVHAHHALSAHAPSRSPLQPTREGGIEARSNDSQIVCKFHSALAFTYRSLVYRAVCACAEGLPSHWHHLRNHVGHMVRRADQVLHADIRFREGLVAGKMHAMRVA